MSEVREHAVEVRDEVAANIRDRVNEIEDNLKHGMISIAYVGQTKLNAFKDGFTDQVSSIKDKVVEFKTGMVENVRMVGLEATDSIRDSIDKSLCKVKDSSIATKEVITETFEKLDEATSDAKAKTQELIENLSCVLQNTSEDFADKGIDIQEDIQTNVEIAREKTVDRLTDISETVEDNMSTLKRNFRDFSLHDQFCDAFDELSEGICSCKSRVSESMYSVGSDLEETAISQASEVLEEGLDAISAEIAEISYNLRSK